MGKPEDRLLSELAEMQARIAALETAHRKEVEALKLQVKKYRDLYDNAPDMYHSLDKNGVIIDCNETEARVLGYRKDEIIGRPFEDFVTDESKRLFKQNFPKLNRERTQLILEREFVKKDGTVIPVSLNVFNELDENGEFTGTRTLARDITERKKMEEELLRVHKLESIGVLAGGIAHDFNNLLTAIAGNISLAGMHATPGDGILERLREAEKASMRAKDLTPQRLTFSSGGEPVKKTVCISELVKESAGFTLSGSGVKCELSIAGDLWAVDIDEGQISQVVNNLVINAEQSMPEGGTIRVSCENAVLDADSTLPLLEGGYVRVSIEDNGIGIPREYLTKIFDPYFTTKHQGNGLGLSVAHSIIKKHNGCITLESEPGKGTTFHVYLPASSKKAVKRQEQQRVIAGQGRILVMDDEDMIRDVAGCMLQHMGYSVEFAKDGAEAIRTYEKASSSGEPFDAIILDITVPGGMGGKAAIKELRKRYPDIRAVVSSGYSNDPVMADFRKYGFSSVVAKPYRLEELSAVLHSVISGVR
ncbi:MAG TPA: ATP-binding protein [Dissulfurispiraceae bacterium]